MQDNIKILIKSEDRTNLQLIQHEFKGFYFPGGEPHVEICHHKALRERRIIIDARIGNMNDMGMLLAVTSALQLCCVKTIELLLPYFPGARQDRKECGYALTVGMYAKLINAQKYDAVYLLDPHSPVTPALVDRCETLGHNCMIKKFVGENLITGLISPDTGAMVRTREFAKFIGCNNVIQAEKKRDVRTGKLTGFAMEPLPTVGRYLVVDDLCDGGGTFLGLAGEYRKDPNGKGPLDLWVTHGIFSKGLDALSMVFNRIGCTDSFPPYHWDKGTTSPTVINILDHLALRVEKEKFARSLHKTPMPTSPLLKETE